MEPIENEPRGWDENQQANSTDFGGQADKEITAPEPTEVNTSGNDLAGIAAGNVPEEEQEDLEDDSATDEVKSDDPRGFMGDFASPQHDE
jgi:hypothetical protein